MNNIERTTIEADEYTIKIAETIDGAAVKYYKGDFSNDTGTLFFESLRFIEEDRQIINGPQLPKKVADALHNYGFILTPITEQQMRKS